MSDPTGAHPPDINIWMIHHDLTKRPQYGLPEGYAIRFYRPGDLRTWLTIQALDPFFTPDAAYFARSVPGDDQHLARRVMFMVAPDGADVGTITAWDNSTLRGQPIGQIHWVALRPEVRGQGLGRPLLSAACDILHARGYTTACLSTNTRRIPAINLYLRFGFVPLLHSQAERDGWEAIAPLLRS